jgi:hypothetical protein
MSLLLDKADTMIDLLRYIAGFDPIYMQDVDMSKSPAALTQTTNMLQELCLAASMPSAPQRTEEFTVGNVQVVLAQNESRPLIRVEVTNDDVAQPLWVSQIGVLVATGRVILAQQTAAFVLPEGQRLAGICVIPNISVRVSYGYDFFSILDNMRRRQLEGERQWIPGF